MLNAEEQQIEIEVIAGHVEMYPAPHEGEPGSELSESADDSVYKGLFQIAFGCVAARSRKSKT